MRLLANDLPLLRVCVRSPARCRDDRCVSAVPVNPRVSLPRAQLVSVTSWNAQPND